MGGLVEGIIASEQLFRDTRAGDLNALKAIGEIEAQPTDRLYRQSLANEHNADAATKMAALEAAKRQQTLDAQFDAQEREALAKRAAGQGRIATQEDLDNQRDPLGRMRRRLDFMAGKVPDSVYTAEVERLAKIEQNFAAAKEHEADAMGKTGTAEANRIKEKANLAGALLQNPSQYSQLLAQAIAEKKDVRGFPPTYSPSVAPLLEAVRDRGIEAAKQIELQMKKKADASEAAVRVADIAAKNATIAKTQEATKALQRVSADIAKNGGNGKPLTEAQKLKNLADKARLEAQERKNWSVMPADPKYLTVGQGYVAADKTKWIWDGVKFVTPVNYVKMLEAEAQ